MPEEYQGLLYYIRYGFERRKPFNFIFSLSMASFAAMLLASVVYYATEFGVAPNLNFGFMARANQFFNSGDYAQAADEYQYAAAIWPTNTKIIYNQGLSALEAGDIEQAIEIWQQFLKIKPDDSAIHFGLGHAYGRSGDFQAAIDHFSQATSLGPATYMNLGEAYEKSGQLQQAAESYLRAEELAPGFPRAVEKYDAVMSRMR